MAGEESKCGPVLVPSAAAGAGHVRAAEALTAAFREKGIEAKHLEVLQLMTGHLRRFPAS